MPRLIPGGLMKNWNSPKIFGVLFMKSITNMITLNLKKRLYYSESEEEVIYDIDDLGDVAVDQDQDDMDLALLKAILEFKVMRYGWSPEEYPNHLPEPDSDELYEFVVSLSIFNIQQDEFVDRFLMLREKYTKIDARIPLGGHIYFATPTRREIYDLSNIIWGGDPDEVAEKMAFDSNNQEMIAHGKRFLVFQEGYGLRKIKMKMKRRLFDRNNQEIVGGNSSSRGIVDLSGVLWSGEDKDEDENGGIDEKHSERTSNMKFFLCSASHKFFS